MKEASNKLITWPSFTPADRHVLVNIDRAKLAEWIEFLRSYRKVMWRDLDTGELVTREELQKREGSGHQSRPEYPQILKEMGAFFCGLFYDHQEFIIDLKEAGFFTEGSRAALFTGTLWSASLTANFIFDAYHRDRFCDGLFGLGVDNGWYLKLLLHLEDLVIIYQLGNGRGGVNK